MSRGLRRTLGVAGAACLLLALLPYYSHTRWPAAGSGVPAIELPAVGLPLGPSKTVLRFGLPFSPLLMYMRESTFASQPAGTPVAATGDEIEPGATVSNGDVHVHFSGEIRYTNDWQFGIFSLSSALAVLGLGLLIIANWSRRSGPLTRADAVG